MGGSMQCCTQKDAEAVEVVDKNASSSFLTGSERASAKQKEKVTFMLSDNAGDDKASSVGHMSTRSASLLSSDDRSRKARLHADVTKFVRATVKGRGITYLRSDRTKSDDPSQYTVIRVPSLLTMDKTLRNIRVDGEGVAISVALADIEDIYTIEDGPRCFPDGFLDQLEERERGSLLRILAKSTSAEGTSPRSSTAGTSPKSAAGSPASRQGLASRTFTSTSGGASRSFFIVEASPEHRARLLESLKVMCLYAQKTNSSR
mmetsp:Transcript_76970/g.222552  ORF Transcript_76970/g.222552 Transcript_76970/m.222552 type:complete len:261 (-) Transcript_76970:131-913(-)